MVVKMTASVSTRWPTTLRRRSVLPAARLLLVLGAIGLAGCGSPSVRDTPSNDENRSRAQLQTQLGIGYLRQGQTEVAFQRLRVAVEADPSYAPGHNALGLLYERLQQTDKAGAHYGRATELDPNFAPAHNNYGGWLCRHQRYPEAEEHFAKAADNPLYGVPELAYFNAGVCMQKKGDPVRAAELYRKSLQKNSKFPQALYAMSELSLAAEKHLSARAYLQRYLDEKPHTPRTLWLGVQIERVLRDKNALSSYSVLLRSKHPNAPETKKLLASEQP